MNVWQEKIIKDFQIDESVVTDPIWEEYPIDFEKVYDRLKVTDLFEHKFDRSNWHIFHFAAFVGSLSAMKEILGFSKDAPKVTTKETDSQLKITYIEIIFRLLNFKKTDDIIDDFDKSKTRFSLPEKIYALMREEEAILRENIAVYSDESRKKLYEITAPIFSQLYKCGESGIKTYHLLLIGCQVEKDDLLALHKLPEFNARYRHALNPISSNFNSLHFSALGGNIEILQINKKCFSDVTGLLQFAAMGGNVDMVGFVISEYGCLTGEKWLGKDLPYFANKNTLECAKFCNDKSNLLDKYLDWMDKQFSNVPKFKIDKAFEHHYRVEIYGLNPFACCAKYHNGNKDLIHKALNLIDKYLNKYVLKDPSNTNDGELSTLNRGLLKIEQKSLQEELMIMELDIDSDSDGDDSEAYDDARKFDEFLVAKGSKYGAGEREPINVPVGTNLKRFEH